VHLFLAQGITLFYKKVTLFTVCVRDGSGKLFYVIIKNLQCTARRRVFTKRRNALMLKIKKAQA